MDKKAYKVMDLTIDESSGFRHICPREQLFEFTRYVSRPSILTELASVKSPNIRKDAYDNEIFDILENINFKTRPIRFNILKLFKPGELLSSVINN